MNGNDLRYYLEKQDLDSLTENEIDFLSNKISFNTYLNRCYQDYCNSISAKTNRGSRKRRKA